MESEDSLRRKMFKLPIQKTDDFSNPTNENVNLLLLLWADKWAELFIDELHCTDSLVDSYYNALLFTLKSKQQLTVTNFTGQIHHKSKYCLYKSQYVIFILPLQCYFSKVYSFCYIL